MKTILAEKGNKKLNDLNFLTLDDFDTKGKSISNLQILWKNLP